MTRAAFVTGVSEGIGLAVTRQLTGQGCSVFCVARTAENVATTGGKQGVALVAPCSAPKHGVVGFIKAKPRQ